MAGGRKALRQNGITDRKPGFDRGRARSNASPASVVRSTRHTGLVAVILIVAANFHLIQQAVLTHDTLYHYRMLPRAGPIQGNIVHHEFSTPGNRVRITRSLFRRVAPLGSVFPLALPGAALAQELLQERGLRTSVEALNMDF